ncbi:MAG: MFS transporter, partial [Coriobacteriales bacterium]|nr:MFS transporter [Coriobacteriales bacterium]
VFGIKFWPVMACLWALIPIYNIFNFMNCPIEHLTEEGEGLGILGLFKLPLFWVAIVLMICAGASELSMAQWASAYAESALQLTKSVGDIAGPCMFAISMGICRTFYGKYGEKIELTKFMIGSGILCLLCYLVASLSSLPIIGLMGCIVCGFSVGIMWPGTISITSSKIPMGGTAMFALLAMAGDLGGSVGPAAVGFVTQSAGDNLQAGMLAGSIFPIVLVISAFIMSRHKANISK